MPKGIVKCGNCKQWDLFRDGDKGLSYSISTTITLEGLKGFKSGFYYLKTDKEGLKIVPIVRACSSCGGEGSVWAWGDEGGDIGGVFIYQDDSLMDSRGAFADETHGASVVWYRITIDEDTGRSWMGSPSSF